MNTILDNLFANLGAVLTLPLLLILTLIGFILYDLLLPKWLKDKIEKGEL